MNELNRIMNETEKETRDQQARLDKSNLTIEERLAVFSAMRNATFSTKVTPWVIKFLMEDLLSDYDLFANR